MSFKSSKAIYLLLILLMLKEVEWRGKPRCKESVYLGARTGDFGIFQLVDQDLSF